MAQQLVNQGVVTGFVPKHGDYAIVSNGPYQVAAYINGPVSNVKVGSSYQVYKIDTTYYLGQEVPGK